MSLKRKILIIEDEHEISNYLASVLKKNNFNTLIANKYIEGKIILNSHCPDLILLDLGLPDCDGVELIKETREWSTIPIIVISARTDEKDKVEALDCGADDYITKPFTEGELLARIRASLRHSVLPESNKEQGLIIKVKDLVIDYDKYKVTIKGKQIHLTNNEFRILFLLASKRGKVLTYDYIIRTLWGPEVENNNQALRVHMAHLRRKIEQNPAQPEYIFTEVGVGYRLVES